MIVSSKRMPDRSLRKDSNWWSERVLKGDSVSHVRGSRFSQRLKAEMSMESTVSCSILYRLVVGITMQPLKVRVMESRTVAAVRTRMSFI